MLKDDRIRLQHMLDAASEALGFIHDKTRFDLDNDRMLVLSLIKGGFTGSGFDIMTVFSLVEKTCDHFDLLRDDRNGGNLRGLPSEIFLCLPLQEVLEDLEAASNSSVKSL